MITTIKSKLENEIQNTKYAWLNNLSVVNLKLKASRVTTRIAEKKEKGERTQLLITTSVTVRHRPLEIWKETEYNAYFSWNHGSTQRAFREVWFLILLTIFHKGDWAQKGCYVNKASKLALPDSLDDGVDKIQGNDNIFLYCKEKAESLGHKLFGVDDKICWADNDGENKYDRYGKSSTCSVSKSGNGSGKEINGDMFVYKYE